MSIIPKQITLCGITITIEIDNSLYRERGIVGEAQYPPQKIALDPTIVHQESLEQNYYHELVHWMFFIMNEHDLRTNEKIVDQLAHLLYQVEKSKTGSVDVDVKE